MGITSEPTACPFCEVASGRETERNKRTDVVWSDEATTAFISPRWWEAAEGHVLVVPNDHFRNLYDISEDALSAVYATVKRVALALKKAYGCNGIMTRQHNEAAGNQDVWHFHAHVFPRYDGDAFYERHGKNRWTDVDERAPYAERLREALR